MKKETLKKVENYYENGQLFERYFLDEADNIQGLYESWHDNGQQYLKSTYKNGKLIKNEKLKIKNEELRITNYELQINH